MSSPHFYQGSQKFIDDVIGLKPIKEEHQAHFDIEPVLIDYLIKKMAD